MKVLMCKPKYYQILWEINPWMKIKNQPDGKLARIQWENLFRIYRKLNLKVILVPPKKGLADMVFTANAGWGRGKKFIVSNFKYKERTPEKFFYLKWLKSMRFEVFTLPQNIPFEGGGDIVTTKDFYLFGFGQRSDLEAKNWLKKFLKLKKPILPLKLVDKRFYHLDIALFYVKPIETIFYYPKAFDIESQKKIEKLKLKKISVSEKEAEDFVLNSIYYKKTIILSFKNKMVAKFLKDKRLKVIFADMSEFKKGGGAAKCLSLFLD